MNAAAMPEPVRKVLDEFIKKLSGLCGTGKVFVPGRLVAPPNLSALLEDLQARSQDVLVKASAYNLARTDYEGAIAARDASQAALDAGVIAFLLGGN